MKIRKYIVLILYLFSIFLICFFSLQISTKSSEESSKITNILLRIIDFVTFHKININYDSFHSFIRKLVGHFGLNMVSGILGFLTFLSFLKHIKKSFIITISIGLIIAVIGELMQLLSIGRSCEIKDMIINFSGCLCGSIIICLICYIVKKKKLNR